MKIGTLAMLLIAPAALALNNRSAVSVSGSDTNPCTTASPCRSFVTAMTVTAPGGEIIALDSAGYGPFTVTQSVTVSGAPGVHAALTVSSNSGITINASASDTVTLRNLVLIGSGGLDGILEMAAGSLNITDCTIRGFSSHGIEAWAGNVTVERSTLLDNSEYGIGLGDAGFPVHGTITDSLFDSNGLIGVIADVDSHVTVVRTTITGSPTGAEASCGEGAPPLTTDLMLEQCTIAHNGTGVASFDGGVGSGFTAHLTLSQNVIAYNNTAVQLSGTPSTSATFGNNRIAGNQSAGDIGSVTTATLK